MAGCTLNTGTSDQSLPDPTTTLRPPATGAASTRPDTPLDTKRLRFVQAVMARLHPRTHAQITAVNPAVGDAVVLPSDVVLGHAAVVARRTRTGQSVPWGAIDPAVRDD